LPVALLVVKISFQERSGFTCAKANPSVVICNKVAFGDRMDGI
jgi:hypothetical protein